MRRRCFLLPGAVPRYGSVRFWEDSTPRLATNRPCGVLCEVAVLRGIDCCALATFLAIEVQIALARMMDVHHTRQCL